MISRVVRASATLLAVWLKRLSRGLPCFACMRVCGCVSAREGERERVTCMRDDYRQVLRLNVLIKTGLKKSSHLTRLYFSKYNFVSLIGTLIRDVNNTPHHFSSGQDPGGFILAGTTNDVPVAFFANPFQIRATNALFGVRYCIWEHLTWH